MIYRGSVLPFLFFSTRNNTMTMTAATKRPAGLCSISDDPAIYVACLASYNSGSLFGYWINLSVADTKEEIQECID